MTRTTWLAVGVACLTTFGLWSSAGALHQQTPLVVQITNKPQTVLGGLSFSRGSNTLLFHSDGDFLGNGNTTPQIFLFDMFSRNLAIRNPRKPRQSIFQITHGLQASLNPRSAQRAKTIAFDSIDDHLNNGSVGRQIFYTRKARWKRNVLPLWQITKGVGESFNPELSFTGRYIAFESTGDLLSHGFTPGNHIYRAEPRRLERLKGSCTSYPCPIGVNPGLDLVTPVEAFNPAIDPSGSVIAFDSREDAAGNNCINGASQIFIRNMAVGGIIEQLTFAPADSRNPVFNETGEALYFESTADLALTGNTRFNIFRVDLTTPLRTITQMTFGTDGDSLDAAPTGTSDQRFFFRSTASLTVGATAGVDRAYLFERSNSPQIVRITDGQGILGPPAGQFVFGVFTSAGDLLGNGNTTQQAFLVNTFLLANPAGSPTPLPTLSPTPIPTPIPGRPATIGLGLLTEKAAHNNDNTLTTVIAGTVADAYGNPVANGTLIRFSVENGNPGIVVSNGAVNANPTCDVSRFEQQTGLTILNQPGVAHVCLTYPGALAGQQASIRASAPSLCVGGSEPGTPCDTAIDCAGIRTCSSTNAVCTIDAECPGGGVCQTHFATCEPTATSVGTFTMPLPVNECVTNGQPCSDYNPCTVGDVCTGGTTAKACVGGQNPGAVCTSDAQCPDLKLCNGGSAQGQLCSTSFDCPAGGVCQVANPGSCELSNPPTCQPGTAITCADDGNACTSDVCNYFTGTCGIPIFCAVDGNPCTDDVCDPLTGTCYAFNTGPCSDDDPCTDDVCDGAGNCGVPNTGAPCEDGDLCTHGDLCSAGVCTPGAAPVCPDDLNPCTNDVCNPTTGTCGLPQACVCP